MKRGAKRGEPAAMLYSWSFLARWQMSCRLREQGGSPHKYGLMDVPCSAGLGGNKIWESSTVAVRTYVRVGPSYLIVSSFRFL